MDRMLKRFNMNNSLKDVEFTQQKFHDRTPDPVTGTGATSPDVISLDISPRKIAYKGNAVPGYLTVRLKTAVPTKGEIIVSGNATNTKIILSNNEFKTDHITNWVPYNDTVKQPLPPGQYTMKINLYKDNGSSTLGIPAGDFVVVHEANPLPVIDNIKISPAIVTQMPESDGAALTISFRVNRHAEVSYEIVDTWHRDQAIWPVKLEPGTYTWNWNGRKLDGTLVDNSEYNICFKGRELNFNNPDDLQFDSLCSTKFIFDVMRIPDSRFREIIKDVSFNTSSITPDGDNIADTVEGSITLNEKVSPYLDIRISDAVGSIVTTLLNLGGKEPGVYNFTWDGKDLFGNIVPNGTYYIMAFLVENKESGIYVYKDKYIRVLNSTVIKPVTPVQNVRIIPDYTWINLKHAGTYLGLKGAVYPIVEFMPYQTGGAHYKVLLAEGVQGDVNIADVEWIDLDKVPMKWGRVVNASAEIRTSRGSDYTVLEYVPQGNTIRILNKEGDWYRVVLGSSKQGYAKVSDLLEVATPTPQPPTPPTAIEHIVVSGDVLWKIAQKYGVSVNDIIAANNLNPNGYLTIGQKLIIPKKAPVVPGAPVFPKIYYALPGDTYWKISQAHGITLQDLYITNRIPAGSPLWVNRKLIIPGVYFVVAGDTLWKIAQKHKITIDRILQINGIDINKPLYIGQKILIGM